MSDTYEADGTRRDFLYYATAGAGAVTAAAAVWPLVNQMNPSADVKALASIRVDVSDVEPGTQLTMRTFHVGGTAQIKEESQIVAQTNGKLNIINKNLIEDSKKNIIVMGRNTQLSIEDENGRQLAIYKVNYGSKLFFKDGEIVEKGKNHVPLLKLRPFKSL